MSGTKEGGAKAAATNKARHGDGFYARIGAMGGRNGTTGGFASDVIGKDGLTGRERAKIAGAKGGSISRRGSAKKSSGKSSAVLTREKLEKRQEAIKTPEHGTRESIHRWHSLFRHGKTVVEDEDA